MSDPNIIYSGAIGGLAASAGTARPIPLCEDILQRTSNHLAQAREISGRLWQLRERLLGAPNTDAVTDPTKSESAHFAGAFADRASDLSYMLSNIENLTMELANRL